MNFRAWLVSKEEGQAQALRLVEMGEDELMEGEVDVAVSHSTLNYKDGLALTGASPVVRRWPMVPGVDLAGKVVRGGGDGFKEGDVVVVNGWGMGETHYGGYAERARVKAGWPVAVPKPYTAVDAMTMGTAGYTAMLSVLALEKAGLKPEMGKVLVTGAAGGVGSVAVALLSRLGWEVVASTGRVDEETEYLRGLGAGEIVARDTLNAPGRPMGKEQWIGAVDAVGSHTLANVLASTAYGGAVAACGLAQGMDLPASVAPFILRGVSLLGIDSVMAPLALRKEAWARLANDLPPDAMASMRQHVSLEAVAPMGKSILEGKIRGRVVVNVTD